MSETEGGVVKSGISGMRRCVTDEASVNSCFAEILVLGVLGGVGRGEGMNNHDVDGSTTAIVTWRGRSRLRVR